MISIVLGIVCGVVNVFLMFNSCGDVNVALKGLLVGNFKTVMVVYFGLFFNSFDGVDASHCGMFGVVKDGAFELSILLV